MAALYKGKLLRYVEIAAAAEKFLVKTRPQRPVPVPIEEIIESELDAYIVPESGLWHTYEIAGWSSLDEKTIYIDTDIYMKHEQWARFTLAHEIGHFVLHHKLLTKKEIETLEDWKTLVLGQQEDEIDFEWQADAFAGCLLMPTQELAALVQAKLEDAKAAFKKYKMKWDEEVALMNISPAVARHFLVTDRAAEVRLTHWNGKQRYK